MSKVFIEEQTLTDIADAVRGKTGSTELIPTVELATAITNIPTGGRNPLELLYTEGAEITPEDWGSVDLKVKGGGATVLVEVNTRFTSTTFKSIVFPDTQTTTVGFVGGLLENFDSGKNMGGTNNQPFCFNNCRNLKKLTMGENFLPFGNYSFVGCVSLEEVHYRGTIDKWAEATRNSNYTRSAPFGDSGGGSFYLSDSAEPLTEINLTTATSVQGGAFYNFKDILKAHLGASVASIGATAIQGCIALDALILEGDTVKTLSNVNAFTSTPIADGTGYIYVPSALLEEYKVATNWATYATQFRAIEDYPEITGEDGDE